MKKVWLFPILTLLLCLSSCTFNSFAPFTAFPSINDDYQLIQGDNYYKPDKYTIDYQTIFRSFPHETDRDVNLSYTGDAKLLVIPVSFSDYPCSMTKLGCNDTRTQIKNAFFGKKSRTNGESIASYYAKSSFGKLRITGEVSDWYESDMSSLEIKDKGNSQNNLKTLLLSAVEWVREKVDISKYDQDKDGFIDAVCFIYSAPYEYNTPLWAYKSTINSKSNIDSPSLKNYVWESCSFMNLKNSFSKPETRTYIHEVGHLLGLYDYYPLQESQSFFPLGKSDMMDLNIGDHNVFSKMLLNWTRPYVVTDECEITIHPSYLNGECILVKNNWNGSALDEYILLEFYSPKGLNERDSKLSFIYNGNEKVNLISKNGIKIYHVDARIGHFKTYSNSPFIGYDSDAIRQEVERLNKNGQLTYQKIANTNTASLSPDGNYLITLLEPDGSTFNRVSASNKTLFTDGSELFDFTFNDGSNLGYKITIKTVNSKSATIVFSKI